MTRRVGVDPEKLLAREEQEDSLDSARNAAKKFSDAKYLSGQLKKKTEEAKIALAEIPDANAAIAVLAESGQLPAFEQRLFDAFLNAYSGLPSDTVPLSVFIEFTSRYGEYQTAIVHSFLSRLDLPYNTDPGVPLESNRYFTIGCLGMELSPPSCGCAGEDEEVTVMRRAGVVYICEDCGESTDALYPPERKERVIGRVGLKGSGS